MNEQIVILDFGRNTRRSSRAACASATSIPSSCATTRPPRKSPRSSRSGIILSGGPSSVYAKDAPLPDQTIFELGVPVLGICFGVQLFAQFLGGKVEKGQKREYGKGTLTIKDKSCALFAKLPEKLAGLEFPRRQAHETAQRLQARRRHGKFRIRGD